MKRVCWMLFCLAAFALPAIAAGYFPLWQTTPPNITDLALIYQGGAQRPPWTTNRYAAYVSYKNPRTSHEEWLFDGFLFIEFVDGHRHAYEPLPKTPPAQKEQWQTLIDKNFGPDGLPELEAVCRATASRIGPPLRRRQVILTLPIPIPGQTNWGMAEGRALDFNRAGDRLAACRWYMDAALARWRALAPKELDLAGFYWLQESPPIDTNFSQALARAVHERGGKFFWIPYWQPGRAQRVAHWREYGFDEAWQQPNHFFHPEVPDSRLQQACDFGKQHGLGMEMEFDSRMITRPTQYERRLDAYLAAYAKNGVKTNSAVAWYEGGGAFYELAHSTNAAMRAHYDDAADFILTRQHLADDLCRKAHSQP